MGGLSFSSAPLWLQWLLAVLAIGGFVIAVIKGVPPAWAALTRFVTTINALGELPEELAELRQFRIDTEATLKAQDTKIDEIHHETHENNGSSIKDSSHRIEKGVAGLYKRVDIVDESLGGIHGRLDEVDRKIAALEQSDEDLRNEISNTQPKE